MESWAIIGMGFISPRHATSIQGVGDRILATVDPDPEKGAFFPSLEALMQDSVFEKIQNVAICTPNYLHVPMALTLVEQGKKVLCEKPLGISSREIKELPNDGTVFTVHQLRHHPAIQFLKGKTAENVSLEISVPRGDSYWEGWKGKKEESGGILFNIGVHYFDLLVYLYGTEYETEPNFTRKDHATGRIRFQNGPLVDYSIRITPESEPGKRNITIDGTEVPLSNSANLSYEDLHKFVYQDFKKGIGTLPQDALRTIELIERL